MIAILEPAGAKAPQPLAPFGTAEAVPYKPSLQTFTADLYYKRLLRTFVTGPQTKYNHAF